MNLLEKHILSNKLTRTTPFDNDHWGDIYCFSTDIFPFQSSYMTRDSTNSQILLVNDMHFSHVFRLFLLIIEQRRYKTQIPQEIITNEIINLFMYCLANILYVREPVVALTLLNRSHKFQKKTYFDKSVYNIEKEHKENINIMTIHYMVGKIFIHTHEEAHAKVANDNLIIDEFKQQTERKIFDILRQYENNPEREISSFYKNLSRFLMYCSYAGEDLKKIYNIYNEVYADYLALESVYSFLQKEFPTLSNKNIKGTEEFAGKVILFLYILSDLRERWLRCLYIAHNNSDGFVHSTIVTYMLSEEDWKENVEMFDRVLAGIRLELPLALFLNDHSISINYSSGTSLFSEVDYITDALRYFINLDFVNEIITESKENLSFLKGKHGDGYTDYISYVFLWSLNA